MPSGCSRVSAACRTGSSNDRCFLATILVGPHAEPRARHRCGAAGQSDLVGGIIDGVEGRFGLALHRRGMAIPHKLGIRTRHLCRNMTTRLEAPRKRAPQS
jgi:hypothetical protein